MPHIADDHCNTTIPNKLFDYMAAGLAVVATDAGPLRRIVTGTGCGRIYRGDDPEDFVRAMIELRDAERRVEAGRAGQRAVDQRYNWDHDARRLVEAIQRVGGSS